MLILRGLCDRACSRNTCLNGGTCTVNDETRMFQCECPLGFSGLLCQDNCSLHCVYGSCVKGTFGDEQCQCFDGWMGSLCDKSVDEEETCHPVCGINEICGKRDGKFVCESTIPICDCQNNGTCVTEGSDFKCDCTSGFTGQACEQDVNECEFSDSCKNGGICENLYGSFKCQCAEGFSGRICDKVIIKACPLNYCENQGECSSSGMKLICNCPPGFVGERCEQANFPDTSTKANEEKPLCKCDNPLHECQMINGTPKCACPAGWVGENCDQQKLRPCDKKPCENDGHCVDDGQNLFTCFCLPQWTGDSCSEPVECLVNGRTCENGGKCVFSITARTSCECEDGFAGENCEKSTNLVTTTSPTCSDIRCQNGGSCKMLASGEATCECLDGFEPPLCEPKSACSINPCKNGGTCQDADGQYFCHCENGFEGVHCESFAELTTSTVSPTSAVLELPEENDLTCDDCQNGANCLDAETGPLCICPNGFFGSKCDQKYNKCSSMTCPTGQNCVHQFTGSQNISALCSCNTGRFGKSCELETSATFASKSLYIHQSSKFSLGTSSYDKLSYELEFSFRTTVENTHLASSENILGEKILSIHLSNGFLIFNISGENFDGIPMKMNDAKWYLIEVKSQENKLEVEVKTEYGFSLMRKQIPVGLEVFLTRFGKISASNYFIGCLADVRVDGELIIFSDNQRAVEIRKGCTRSEQCSRDYCQNGGECVDHWESSSCKCKAPFLKPTCIHSLPKTTFGHSDQPSIVHLSTSESENHLLRNEIDLSFLMRSRKSDAFLLYLGEKQQQTQQPNSADVLTNYLVVKIVGGLVTARYRTGGRKELEISSKNRVDDNIEHHINIRIDRNRRQIKIDDLVETDEIIFSRMSQEFFVDEILIGSSVDTDADYFKGYLQDLQINQKSVMIHPTTLNVDSFGKIERVTNIIEGAISDSVCNNSLCKYGECLENFNDFTCKCSEGFTGPLCDKIDFCKDSKCLEGSTCENSNLGYYCVFPISLSNNSRIKYGLSSRSKIPQMNFSIRTHSINGNIFKLNDLIVKIVKRRLLISNMKIDLIVSDGIWHQVQISPHKVIVDGKSFVSQTQLYTQEKKLESILLIGDNDPIIGCIDGFVIGDYPKLSFTKQKIPTSVETWMMLEKTSVGTGCLSSNQCGIYSTCLNGATCVDAWNKRKCQCLPGFGGDNCEININECQFMDCGKHGYCSDSINRAKCVCDQGFSGDYCQISDDECEGIKCHNSGRCVKNDNNAVYCKCTSEWMGQNCNISMTNTCDNSPCQNGGQCLQKTTTSFECSCMPGFIGELCEHNLANDCDHKDCNRGHCVMTVSGPACQCDFGYTGRFCEKLLNSCSSNTCSSRGSCLSVWNSTVCQCDEKWRGNTCQHPINSCSEFPCQNDGVCSNEENDESNYKCNCQKYYLGKNCEQEGSCLRASCVNGECIQLSADHHTCSCNIGYEGDSCDKRIDYCKNGPCINNGICENQLTGYKCQCPAGFEGSDCEINIDECALGYCKNGAKCRDKINDFECICDNTGYQGRNCTIDINECESADSCLNGECSNTLGGYKCACRSNFIGPRCSLRNPCSAQITSNNISSISCVHGKCVNPVVKIENNREVARYECACDRGYTGPNCSQKIKEAAMSNISYLFGPIVAVVIVFIILGCLLLFFVIRGNNSMHGHYSPSSHEFSQTRVGMPTVIKLPPQERLI
ncbi:unnamed protein product [Caenorhabditis angaria]|uniref:Uncharacterized protein n=1 Tax=Caenorhabditis angaria TaxID=860376 RepID=A0A9P1J3G0_9PELO|nr:unnamed protein product [Caenorhabditis angaria]